MPIEHSSDSGARRSSIHRIATATTPDAVIELVTELGGPNAELFALDHAVDRLVPVRADSVGDEALRDERRRAMLRCETFHEDDSSWIPIPDRDQPMFVLRCRQAPAGLDPNALAELGPIMSAHRKRFEALEHRRRRDEMSTAAELQWDLLPLRADYSDDLHVAGVLEPAYEVAGDAFDYAFWDGSLWAYALDGMGHGTNATLAVSVAVAAIRNARRRRAGLDEQFEHANRAVFEQWSGDCFVTAIGCRVDSSATEFVNAGHEPVRTVTGGTVSGLELSAGLPLGIEPDIRYPLQEGLRLADGDGIVLLSDGPAGARGAHDGLELGSDELEKFIAESWSDRPLETAHDVLGRVLDHIGSNDVTDDLTAVVIRLQGESQ